MTCGAALSTSPGAHGIVKAFVASCSVLLLPLHRNLGHLELSVRILLIHLSAPVFVRVSVSTQPSGMPGRANASKM